MIRIFIFFHLEKVVDIQMIKDRTIRTAWVEFETKQDLIQALDLNNRAVRGRNISMSLDRGGSDRYGSGGKLFFFFPFVYHY